MHLLAVDRGIDLSTVGSGDCEICLGIQPDGWDGPSDETDVDETIDSVS